MRSRLSVFVALHLALVASATANATTVCGSARTLEDTPLPASARAELLPMVRAYRWELDLLSGDAEGEPAETAVLAAGRYCLEAPGAGLWKVVVAAPGFVAMARFPLALHTSAESLELPPVRLRRDDGVSVTVVGEDRRSSADARPAAWVVARPVERSFWSGEAAEGWRPSLRYVPVPADGRVTLPRAPGEALDLELLTAGSALTTTARTGASGSPVSIGRPAAGASRGIEVVDEEGAPLPDVAVLLADHGWPVGVTDEIGRLVLAAGPGGLPSLVLETEDGRRRVVEPPEPSSPAPEGAVVRLALLPTPALRGKVLDGASRRPLPGALVWLGPDPGTHAATGADGGFVLPGGGRERVRVEADAPGHLARGAVAEARGPAEGERLELLLQPAGSLTGRVIDGDGAPLAGVALAARPEPAQGARGATPATSHSRTGADGRFRLPGLRPAAGYRVVAEREGFAARSLAGVTVPPRERSLDLGDVVLRPGVRLAGRVVDARGRPLSEAEVRARDAEGLPTSSAEARLRESPPDGTSGPDGRFSLSDLSPGHAYDLLVTRPGYLPAWKLGIEISTGGSGVDPVTVELAAASRLSGLVLDRDGGPVPGARVELSWDSPPAGTVGVAPLRPPSRSTETDDRGEFAFEEIAPGAVSLQAWAESFLSGPATRIDLPPGDGVDRVRLVLSRGARVVGRVFDPGGEPVAGAEVWIGTARTASDAGGEYRLEGVPPGPSTLAARHPDYRIRAEEVLVEPGDNRVDVHLEDGWRFTGRVVSEDGDPVVGAQMILTPVRPDAVGGYSTSSREGGDFRFVVSSPGTYGLRVLHPEFAVTEQNGLEIGPDPLDGLDVVLSRGATLSGRVLGLRQDELARLVLEARRDDPAADGVTTLGSVDPEGVYAVPHLSPGSWRLRATLTGGRRQAEAAVTVEPGVGEVIRDLEFAGVALTGRVSSEGEPIAGAHVQLSGLTASGERSVITGHDGGFRIDDLSPGRYRLDVLDRNRALSYVEDLELSADRHVELELSSEPLVGTVTDAESGEPLAEATVTVRKALGGSGELGPMIELPTDASGRFVVAHVTPGDYVVSARRPGYAPADRTVRLSPGETPPPVHLRLSATDGVTLTVRLADGGTPRFATVSAFDGSGRLLIHDTRVVSDRGFAYFDQIPAGTWDLLVSAAGTAPTWVRAEVPDGRPEVVLPPAAPLEVRVPGLMESGGAGSLSVASASGSIFFQVDPAGEIRTRWTVHAGLLTLADVPAGSWTLRVDGAQGGTWTGTAATDGRSPAQVTLE